MVKSEPKTVPSPANEALYGAVVEATRNAVVLVDGNGRIVLVNEATERMFGAGRADLLGRPRNGTFVDIGPDGEPSATPLAKLVEQSAFRYSWIRSRLRKQPGSG